MHLLLLKRYCTKGTVIFVFCQDRLHPDIGIRNDRIDHGSKFYIVPHHCHHYTGLHIRIPHALRKTFRYNLRRWQLWCDTSVVQVISFAIYRVIYLLLARFSTSVNDWTDAFLLFTIVITGAWTTIHTLGLDHNTSAFTEYIPYTMVTKYWPGYLNGNTCLKIARF